MILKSPCLLTILKFNSTGITCNLFSIVNILKTLVAFLIYINPVHIKPYCVEKNYNMAMMEFNSR